MQTETIAIISTVLNEVNSIKNLLDDFLAQTRKAEQIIIVDGGSTDGTLEVLQDYKNNNPSIHYIVAKGVNIARGRNIAIAHANTSIIAATDGGCHPESTWLEELVKPLLDNPDFAAVSGVRKIESVNSFELFAGALSTSGNSNNEEDRVFHGRNSSFRKSLWAASGGYPEWLYTAEDTLFAQKAKALGFKVALASKAVISWRPRPNLKKLAKQYFLYGRGTGRIAQADLTAAFYHLRNHAIWIGTFLLGFYSYWFWLLSFATLFFMYLTLIRPVLNTLKKQGYDKFGLYTYVPIIVMTRSLYNNIGQLYGHWEYCHVEPFKRNHDLYSSGQWKMASIDE